MLRDDVCRRRILVIRNQPENSHLVVVVEPPNTVHLSDPDLTAAQVERWLSGQTPGLDYVPDRSERNVLADVLGEPCLRWQPRWDTGG